MNPFLILLASCLYVDNFGIKYYSKEDINHLLNALGQNYTYSTD